MKRCRDEGTTGVSYLPLNKRGRPLLLTDDLDRSVQRYLCKVRECGGVVTGRIALAAAKGIVTHYDKAMLSEFGGHLQLNLAWGYSLLKRMNFVQRKVTTSKSKHSVANFKLLKEAFLQDVVTTVEMEEIPPHLILNWDQTGIKIVPSSSWTMNQSGAKRVEVCGVNDKRMITCVFCGTAVGDFLPPQVIYQGKTARCHPHFEFPVDWNVTHSPRHWSNESTMLEYIDSIIIPYVESQRKILGDKPAVVIMDNFKGQITRSINEFLELYNIHVVLLPANTTDLLQPMDLSINKPAKDYLKRCFEDWYCSQITDQLQVLEDDEDVELSPVDFRLSVLKELGAKWLVDTVNYIRDNPQFVVNGFVKAGILGALDGDFEEQEDDAEEDETGTDDETDTETDDELPMDGVIVIDSEED